MPGTDAFDVIVVGGGLAGLSAARTLVEKGVTSVCVVEANTALGGRVRQVHGVAPWPLEAGPEFIHGEKGSLVEIVTAHVGLKLHEAQWPDWLFWGDRRALVAPSAGSEDLMGAVDELMFEQVRMQRPHS